MNLRSLLIAALFVMMTLGGCSSSQPTASGPSEAPTVTTDASSDDASSGNAASDSASSDDEASEDDTSGEVAPDVDPGPAPDPSADDLPEDDAPVELIPNSAATDWFHQNKQGPNAGLGTDAAYRTVLEGRQPQRTVTVAILDSGVDIEHEDLRDNIWVNEDEVPDNGVDDDDNGYVDDVHGWNFIGGPDGENVEFDTLELTRLYVKFRDRFGDVSESEVAPEDTSAYNRYQKIKAEFQRKRTEAQQQLPQVRQAYEAVQISTQVLKNHLNTDTLTEAKIRAVQSSNPRVSQSRNMLVYFYDQDFPPDQVEDYYEYLDRQVEYNYNPDFDPRPIVGDDYDDKTERIYGNNDVIGPDASHGTHVAGIVAAVRDNGLGIDGVATGVQIMSVRTVPNGDERDKDVANAIRYAVDNGADVINMSFGKGYSPYKSVVDDAVRYAESNGVLLIHAAGNSSANTDSTDNFPSRTFEDGGEAQLWIEVGAASWKGRSQLAASFSNYGATTVDVFAPGESIYSTTPGNAYEDQDGTSMAAPMVSGLAALLMAHYADLDAAEVRQIIIDSAKRFPDVEVQQPGSPDVLVPFGTLSRTGAVVNAVAALKQAEAMQQP